MNSLERGLASIAFDGSEHGPHCYGVGGGLRCGWPEQHDTAFVVALPSPPYRTVVVGRPTGTLVGGLITALMVVVAVVMVGMAIAVNVDHLRFQTVLTNSMHPTVSAGDVAVTRVVPVGSLRVGDAIAFFPPGSTVPVLHRITSLETTTKGVVITTRGDANPVDDPWHVTLLGTTSYRLVAVVPAIGWLTGLQRPALLLAGLLLGFAVLLQFGKEVRARTSKSQSPPQI